MSFALPDPDSDVGAEVARRLAGDMVGWLTSADKAGTPQPAPVWFLWDAASSTALVYTPSNAKRHERIRINPLASLHLNDDGEGHGYVVLAGRMATATDIEPAHRHQAYLEKYGDWISRIFGSAEQFGSMFSVPLIFHPDRVRAG